MRIRMFSKMFSRSGTGSDSGYSLHDSKFAVETSILPSFITTKRRAFCCGADRFYLWRLRERAFASTRSIRAMICSRRTLMAW